MVRPWVADWQQRPYVGRMQQRASWALLVFVALVACGGEGPNGGSAVEGGAGGDGSVGGGGAAHQVVGSHGAGGEETIGGNGGSGQGGDDGCADLTCEHVAAGCGVHVDSCGNVLDCGSCPCEEAPKMQHHCDADPDAKAWCGEGCIASLCGDAMPPHCVDAGEVWCCIADGIHR